MSEPVVIFDHIFKKFARGEQHTSLRDFIPAMVKRMLPGKKKVEASTLHGQEFWAVKDLSFKLHRGESMGIIGPNGSGKSTTLKLLSGILRPDMGTYSVKGRLSALIEVGAGFHPDLTGRENVYLNGCILGMSRREVQKKFNEIVEFAGVEEFIDTPVKRYSSGMAVRLGFAVAAHIDPDVLLVDEVLAVGDMQFRARCHNRMERMRKNGVTMILVSHNIGEVRNLCQNTISLFKGEKVMEGPTPKVLENYYQIISEKIRAEQDKEARKTQTEKSNPDSPISLTGATFYNAEGQPAEMFYTGRPMILRLNYHARAKVHNPAVRIEMSWSNDEFMATVFSTVNDKVELGTLEGKGYIDLVVPEMLVEPNVFAMRVSIGDGTGVVYDSIPRLRFAITEELPVPGVFALRHGWKVVGENSTQENGQPASAGLIVAGAQ